MGASSSSYDSSRQLATNQNAFSPSQKRQLEQELSNSINSNTLTKQDFHNCLSTLEKLGFRTLRNTPLADGLFRCFDLKKSGEISKDSFLNRCVEIFEQDTETKIYTSFLAIKGEAEFIPLNSLMEYLVNTWNSSFESLIEKLHVSKDLNYYFISKKLREYSKDHLKQFTDTAEASLQQYLHYPKSKKSSKYSDPPQPYLDFNRFSQWAYSDRTIKLQYFGVSVQVACTLYNIEQKVS